MFLEITEPFLKKKEKEKKKLYICLIFVFKDLKPSSSKAKGEVR